MSADTLVARPDGFAYVRAYLAVEAALWGDRAHIKIDGERTLRAV